MVRGVSRQRERPRLTDHVHELQPAIKTLDHRDGATHERA